MMSQTAATMRTIREPAPPRAGVNRVLLVMLPGATDLPESFLRYGFVRALRERQLPVDAVLADAHMDYYLQRNIGERIAHDAIIRTRTRDHRQIWVMGISLGGMGALIYARDYPAAIDGMVLLAPFLGNRGTIAGIARGGGLNLWQPDAGKPQDDEQALLAWIKAYRYDDPASPSIHLGYGTSDRFAAASELLAQRLPAAHVTAMPGGHDWDTWTRLWEGLLDRGLFANCATAGAPQVHAGANS